MVLADTDRRSCTRLNVGTFEVDMRYHATQRYAEQPQQHSQSTSTVHGLANNLFAKDRTYQEAFHEYSIVYVISPLQLAVETEIEL